MLIALFLTLTACKNDCQSICVELNAFAEECDYAFTNEMMDECLENQGNKTSEEKQNCSVAADLVREEWTCEDLATYFD